MPTAIHRTERDSLGVPVTNSFSPDEVIDPEVWLVNPSLSAVLNVDRRYWKIVNDQIVEMSPAEKEVADGAILAALKSEQQKRLKADADGLILSKYSVAEISNLLALYADSIRGKINRMTYLQSFVDWLSEISADVQAKEAIIQGATNAGTVAAATLNQAAHEASDPKVTSRDALQVTDVLDIDSRVEDPLTGVQGPFWIMQVLMNRREIFNDLDNVLYHPSVIPILGNGGHLVAQANRILGLEGIHGGLGWHQRQIKAIEYRRPMDLLVYYGWLSAFNGGGGIEPVAQKMARYGVFVLGDGMQSPLHSDYANTQAIINRVKTLRPDALIFGYVDATAADWQTKVDQWDILHVHGIMFDKCGYDFSINRADFKARVDYVHGRTYASRVMANAWNPNHVVGLENDFGYPNATWNAGGIHSGMGVNDWILLESFGVNTAVYTSTNGYEDKAQWAARGARAAVLRSTYGVNLAGVATIANVTPTGQTIFDFAYTGALAWALDAYGSSDMYYAAGSASVSWWTRPNLAAAVGLWSPSPSVQLDGSNANVYRRWFKNGSVALNFSSGTESSAIEIY